MTKKTTPAKEVHAAPEVAPKVSKKIHAVRAEVTMSDGSVKIFSGVAQDSELDLSKIEVNG